MLLIKPLWAALSGDNLLGNRVHWPEDGTAVRKELHDS